MNDNRHVKSPTRHKLGEEFRHPEHQAGKTDGEHPPEDRKKVKFFPIGPAVEFGHFGNPEKPFHHAGDILTVLNPRKKRIRAEVHPQSYNSKL